jgi:hypothetical protein
MDDPCEQHPGRDSGTWRPGTCACTPAPQLPAGADLAALIARARRRTQRNDHHAEVKIRVR